MRISWLCLLAACGTPDPLDCREGFTRAADGHCYPPPPPVDAPTFDDAVDWLPPCTSPTGDGELDIAAGCAGEVCANSTWEAFVAALGEPETCATASWSDAWVYCSWSVGLEGLFPDEDGDLAGDAETTTDWIHVQPDYAGLTVDGLGADVELRCFVDVLGDPDRVLLQDEGGTYFATDVVWDRHGLYAYDWDDADGLGVPDGRPDNLYLYGAP